MAVMNRICPKCGRIGRINEPCVCRGDTKEAFKGFNKDNESKRFYQSQGWKNLSKEIRTKEPFCRMCGRWADMVDHIIPIRAGGDKFNVDNLQPLCNKCHIKKTATDRKKFK